MSVWLLGIGPLAFASVVSWANVSWPYKEITLPSGTYLPFFSQGQGGAQVGLKKSVKVDAFRLDATPVTNGDFLDFVTRHSDWRRSKIPRIFADISYLKHWRADLELGLAAEKSQPVSQVSWFAANAYCESKRQILPTNDQWEFAADDAGRAPEKIKSMILNWYGIPNERVLKKVGKGYTNGYGVRDLFGLIWEWTLDFDSAMFSSETRSSGTQDDNLFCGAGSLSALDAADYAKFMRYSFRASLKAEYTIANLGFRCAREIYDEH